MVSGVPWNVGPKDEKADGEMPRVIKLSEDETEKMCGIALGDGAETWRNSKGQLEGAWT